MRYAVMRVAVALCLLQVASALECLPRRACPDDKGKKFMCVGYVDLMGAQRLVCDGAHITVDTCTDYYR